MWEGGVKFIFLANIYKGMCISAEEWNTFLAIHHKHLCQQKFFKWILKYNLYFTIEKQLDTNFYRKQNFGLKWLRWRLSGWEVRQSEPLFLVMKLIHVWLFFKQNIIVGLEFVANQVMIFYVYHILSRNIFRNAIMKKYAGKFFTQSETLKDYEN